MRRPDGTYQKTRERSRAPGEARELTFSCYRGLPMLASDRTRRWLIEAIAQARSKFRFELWAYVIMPEHVHILLLPFDPGDVPKVLQTIKQSVTQRAIAFLKANDLRWLEKLRAPGGASSAKYHFWQPGGGYDRSINCVKTAWHAVEYIHNNPVRRGLVNTATDWLWSSARSYAGESDVLLEVDACPSS